jgi:M6 family metalloprotease-like protein
MDGSGFDFTPYDTTQTGQLDQLVVLHSGYGAEFGEPPTECSMNSVANRIWSAGTANIGEPWVGRQNIQLLSWALTSAFDSPLCSNVPAKMGQIVHEYIHGWDVPDLYDQDDTEGIIMPGGIGYLDPMSSPFGWYVPNKIVHRSIHVFVLEKANP